MSERPDVRQTWSSVSRTLSKHLSGDQPVSDYWADVIEDQLGLPNGELHEDPLAEMASTALQVLRRLDAGEQAESADQLIALAESTAEAARKFRGMAARFRQEAVRLQERSG